MSSSRSQPQQAAKKEPKIVKENVTSNLNNTNNTTTIIYYSPVTKIVMKKNSNSQKRSQEDESDEDEQPKKKAKTNSKTKDTSSSKTSKQEKKTMKQEDEDSVEAIISWREKNGVRSYKVHWEGFSSEEDTWEQEDDLIEGGYKDKIDEYWKIRPHYKTHRDFTEKLALEREKARRILELKREGVGKAKGEEGDNGNIDENALVNPVENFAEVLGIMGAKLNTETNCLDVAVEWRSGRNTYVSSEILKLYRPFLLIDFFQSRLKLLN